MISKYFIAKFHSLIKIDGAKGTANIQTCERAHLEEVEIAKTMKRYLNTKL